MMVAGGVDAPIAPLILRGFMLMRIMTTSWNDEPRARFAALLARSRRLRARRRRLVLRAGGAGARAGPRRAHLRRDRRLRAPPARPIIACAWKSAAKSRRAPSAWRSKRPASRPEAVQYINYHGTSTELNDRIETRAIKLAFNGHAYKLAGSSLKSLIGHPQGACGAAGIAATLLAMRDGVVPPTINVDEPDPECDLDYVPETARASWISSTPSPTASPSAARIRPWCCARFTRLNVPALSRSLLLLVVALVRRCAISTRRRGCSRSWRSAAVRCARCRSAIHSADELAPQIAYKDHILHASKLLEKDPAGYHLWDTPHGRCWIPQGSDYVLPFNLAEQERQIYGVGEQDVQSRRRRSRLRRQRRRLHARGAEERREAGGGDRARAGEHRVPAAQFRRRRSPPAA